VTVIVYVPVAVALLAFTVIVEELPAVTVAGLKPIVTPAGSPVALSVTVTSLFCQPLGAVALVLGPCRHVHTARMKFTLDVALCDASGRVLRVCTLAPWRVSPLLRSTAFVVEAEAGAFERWRLRVGDTIEIRR